MDNHKAMCQCELYLMTFYKNMLSEGEDRWRVGIRSRTAMVDLVPCYVHREYVKGTSSGSELG